MRRKARRKGDRLVEFLIGRVVICFGLISSGGIVDCINCNPVPRGTGNHPHEALEQFASLRLSRGSNWLLEIALSGFPAKDQPHGLLQPGRRCVETSGDVIELLIERLPNKCRALFAALTTLIPCNFAAVIPCLPTERLREMPCPHETQVPVVSAIVASGFCRLMRAPLVSDRRAPKFVSKHSTFQFSYLDLVEFHYGAGVETGV
jgi:hypothetical protein